MKNLKIKQFEAKIVQIIENQKLQLEKETKNHLSTFEIIDFTIFSNESPFQGEVKNKIFFIYHDHYHANSGTWMQVNELMHSHQNMEDRGYIKGVATDLDGYLKLRAAKNLNHNLDSIARIYLPRFRNSKHKSKYVEICVELIKSRSNELNEFVEIQKKILNEKLSKMTNCSLLYYIQNI
jgi:hypothetical protein